MISIIKQTSEARELGAKIGTLFHKRCQVARDRFSGRVETALREHVTEQTSTTPWDLAASWPQYCVDLAERATLFWDTMRQRGNAFVEHTRQGLPPVLHFDYETVVAKRIAGDVVAPAAHRDYHARFAREVHRRHHVGHTTAAHNDGGSFVDHGIPDRACLIVTRGIRQDEFAANFVFQSGKRVCVERGHGSGTRLID